MTLRTVTFTESITILSSSSQVFSILSDPKQMLGLQPFLTRCDIVSQKLDAPRGTAEYEVYFVEHFKIVGPLGYDNRIHTFVRADADTQRVVYTVHSFPRIELQSTYALTEAQGHTQVNQSVVVQSPAILASIVVSTAQKAQRKLLENLKQRCATVHQK